MKELQKYLSALKLGSEDAFKLIMENLYSHIFNFTNGYLKNDENSKEVVQDVFLLLWEHRSNLADTTSLKAYLFTLARNKCIDFIRREKLRIQFRTDKQDEYIRLTESFDALSDPILDNIIAFELQSEIDEAIANLPDQCRKIFILSRKNGLKNREISDMLSLSTKTVESHITKALRTIRDVVEQKFPNSYHFLCVFIKKDKIHSL